MENKEKKNNNKSGNKKSVLETITEILVEQYDFRYNIVKQYPEYLKKNSNQLKYKQADEKFINTLVIKFKFNNLKTSYSDINMLLNSDILDKYDPFLEYFDNLPKWDESNPSEINRLAETIKTDEHDYFKLCLKRWLIALIASATNPSVVNQQMLVFSGKQGLGKSTWISNLLPESLSEYHYSGSVNPNNKDTYIHLAETLIINLDELTNMNKKQTSSFKEIITQGTINIRKPYSKTTQKLTRRASFIGSINESEFLYDLTGSRRFLCFEVDDINYNNDINIDMVYSEAKYLFEKGEKYFFDKDDIKMIEKMNERFRVKSPLEIKLLQLYSPQREIDYPDDYWLDEIDIFFVLKPISVLKRIYPEKYKYQPPSMGELKTIGSILNMYGFKSKKIKGRKYYELHRRPPKVKGKNVTFGWDENEKNGRCDEYWSI